jgi:hypothetical protein
MVPVFGVSSQVSVIVGIMPWLKPVAQGLNPYGSFDSH